MLFQHRCEWRFYFSKWHTRDLYFYQNQQSWLEIILIFTMEVLLERVQFITHKGVKILREDFSQLGPGQEYKDTLAQARGVISSQPQKSVRALAVANGGHYNSDMLNDFKSFVQDNTPYIRAVAVVGLNGMLSIFVSSLARFSGRDFHVCKDEAEALDWLTAQK